MRFRVRTPDGELTYESFGEVERAYLAGLVEPQDEVLEDGTSRWRKAGAIPELARARRMGNQVWGGTQMIWILIFITFGSVALYLLAKGWAAYDKKEPLQTVALHYWLPGGVLAIILGSLLTTITYRASKRSRLQ
jgi:hypothetical protein